MTILEAVASLGLHVLVLGLLGHTVAANALALTAALSVHRTTIAVRHVEHLLDRSSGRAGRGGLGLTLARDRLVLDCDADGTGGIDTHGAERTAFELWPSSGGQRLVHRIGRQPMTILDGIDPAAHFAYSTTAPTAAGQRLVLVELPLPQEPLRVAIVEGR